MKFFIKISLVLLLIVWNYKPVASFPIELDSRTCRVDCTYISEFSREPADILKKNFDNLKEYSSNPDIIELRFEKVEEEDKRKVNKKQFFTNYKKEYKELKNGKLAIGQTINNRFFVSITPFYKLFHSWKIPSF
ncbi:hypothetical protein [Marivirga aurantiaca]|nr:hypothetical protein [Marivirga aurantiaca]